MAIFPCRRRLRRLAGLLFFPPVLSVLAACQGSGYQVVRTDDLATLTQLLEGQQGLAGSVEALAARDREMWSDTLALVRRQDENRREERAEILGVLCDIRPRGRAPLASCASGGSDQEAEARGAPLPEKQVVGREEVVLLPEVGSSLQAVIDTSATMTFLDGRDIVSFERNGKDWVRFKLYDSAKGRLVAWESQLLRWRESNEHEISRHPVVEMLITLGSITQKAEVVLADRSDRGFPLLIGRNVLQDLMLVDVGQANETPPQPPAPAFGGYTLP